MSKDQKNPLDDKIAELQKEAGVDVGEETTDETTTLEATETEESTEVEAKTDGETGGTSEESTEETTEESTEQSEETTSTDTYTPNYKFKVHDQEYEIDPEFKDVIKSKEVEDKIRDIYTKAYGLETAQKSRDNWKSKHEEATEKTKTYSDIFDVPLKLYKDGKKTDAVRSTFSDEDILEAARHLIRLNQAPADERDRLEKESAESRDSYGKQDEMNDIIKKAQTAEYNAIQARIDLELSKTEVSDVAKFIDSKFGADSFRNEVNLYGDSQYKAGKQIQPDEAVKVVFEKYKTIYTPGAADKANQTVKKVVAPNASKSIPNPKSSGSSGRTGKVKSVADYDRIIKELKEE